MLKKCLLILICIAVFTSPAGCSAVESFIGGKGQDGPDGGAVNANDSAGTIGAEAGSGNDTVEEIPQSEYPVLLMRINVNVGEEESFDVLELTENTITYRYYNFNDANDPQLMVKTVPFGEMLVKENGKDKYSISLYLFDGTDEYELEMTGDLEEKIRQYPEFRKTLGSVLGKPFSGPPDDRLITSEDISASAQKNTKAEEKDSVGGDDGGNDGEESRDGGIAGRDRDSQAPGIDPGYELSRVVYTRYDDSMDCSIDYPGVSGLSDEAVQKKTNDTIREEALKVLKYYEDYESDSHVEISINYHIARKTPALLSIEYFGTGVIAGAPYPHNLYYTTNIDMRTGEKIRLADIVEISDSFVNKFLGGGFKAVNDFQAAALEQIDVWTIKDHFADADRTDSIGTPEHSCVFSYFTTDSLGISIPVAHAIGDHAEFEIRYGDLKDDMKAENDIRKELLSTEIDVMAVFSGIDLENFGQVRVAAGRYDDEGITKLRLVLEDKENGFVSVLPELADMQLHFKDLAVLEALDADGDGLRDIVAIARYVTDPGADGETSFLVAHVYFQGHNTFERDAELEQKINSGEFASAEDVVGLIEKYKAE